MRLLSSGTQAARRHRAGRSSVRYVLVGVTATGTTTSHGNPAWLYVEPDERGRDLEVIAVEITDASAEAVLLVIHVMPTDLRGSGSDV